MHRERFPGVREGWARFDGPAGTQMVDTAIEAMTTWAASGNNANAGGAFEAADACDALLERTRRARRHAPRGVGVLDRVRRQHDDADARLHPGRRADVAPRRPRRRHPPRPRCQRHAVAPGVRDRRCRARARPVRPGDGHARPAGRDRPHRRAHGLGDAARRVEPPRHGPRPGTDHRRRPRRRARACSSMPCTSRRIGRSTCRRSAATCSPPRRTSGTDRTPACCASTRRCSTSSPSPRSARRPTVGRGGGRRARRASRPSPPSRPPPRFLLEDGLDRIAAAEAGRVRPAAGGPAGDARRAGVGAADDGGPHADGRLHRRRPRPDVVAEELSLTGIATWAGHSYARGGGQPARTRRVRRCRARRRRRLHRRRPDVSRLLTELDRLR